MIRLGIERGCSANSYIYSYQSDSDRLALGEKMLPDVMRISVTCDSENDLNELTRSVLFRFSGLLGMGWVLLTGWKVPDPVLTPARARLKEKRCCNAGLVFASIDGYRLGVSSLPRTVFDAFFIDELLTAKSYAICTASAPLPDAKGPFLVDLLRSSARSFAAPDSASVSRALDQAVGAIAYAAKGDSIRPGVVVLARSDEGIAKRIREVTFWEGLDVTLFEAADQVWAL